MSHPIPPEAQTLVHRLRALADELESAARYGVPIPDFLTVSGGEFGRPHFPADAGEFDAWVTYTEAEVTERDDQGRRWRSATADVNGLPLSFATCEALPAEVSA